MKIILGRSFSREFDIVEQISIMNEIENDLNNYFNFRSYGDRIQQIYLGIICVSIGFEDFFTLSKKIKINKKQQEIEYGVKLDFNYYKSLSRKKMKSYAFSEILVQSETMLKTRVVNGFAKDNFLVDLEEFINYKVKI